ncbi:MAG: pyridoxal phosphate-dependent aminotransferase [Bdellovibrionales bacterium]|nr:pyridoxal phosphate-dependent aminotransferase [Bdellovibrionales bacterium]
MYSSRLPICLEKDKIQEILAQKRRNQEQIFDLTSSNPTKANFNYPLFNAAEPSCFNLEYLPEPQGYSSALETISQAWRPEKNLNPTQFFLTSSTSEAYSILFKLFCNGGDEVLLPSPSYPLIEYLAQSEAVVSRKYYYVEAEGWFIDRKSLVDSITKRTKVLVIVNPNNPTGHYTCPEQMADLIQIAQSNNLAIISDEVFYEYSRDGVYPQSFLDVSNSKVPLVILGGLSKWLGLPQAKLSWGYFHCHQDLIREAMPRLSWLLDLYLSVSFDVQINIESMARVFHPVQDQIRGRVLKNERALIEAFKNDPKVRVLMSEGGWNAVLALPQAIESDQWACDLLLKKNVYLYSGHLFEMPFQSFVVSLLMEPSQFARSIKLMTEFLKEI